MRKGIVDQTTLIYTYIYIYSCFCHFLIFTTLPLPIIKIMLSLLVAVCHRKTSNHAFRELSGINQQITGWLLKAVKQRPRVAVVQYNYFSVFLP